MNEYTILLFKSGETWHSVVKENGEKMGGGSSANPEAALQAATNVVLGRVLPDVAGRPN